MAQSLANILLHVVFSTKNRAPYLDTSAVREGVSKLSRRNASQHRLSVAGDQLRR